MALRYRTSLIVGQGRLDTISQWVLSCDTCPDHDRYPELVGLDPTRLVYHAEGGGWCVYFDAAVQCPRCAEAGVAAVAEVPPC